MQYLSVYIGSFFEHFCPTETKLTSTCITKELLYHNQIQYICQAKPIGGFLKAANLF